jgi:hypothetical protein
MGREDRADRPFPRSVRLFRHALERGRRLPIDGITKAG